jgi:hypothetical protein
LAVEDVSNFENECNKLASSIDIEASKCDRNLSAIDRAATKLQQEDLSWVVKQLDDMHTIQPADDELGIMVDLESSRW